MMQSRARRVHRWLLAAALVASDVTAAAEPRGKLVIVIVVDQLRYQDLLWLGGEFGAHGFAGLGDAVPVRYEMALTHTAPGHATLATGAWPSVHGVVANRFMGAAPLFEARPAVESSAAGLSAASPRSRTESSSR